MKLIIAIIISLSPLSVFGTDLVMIDSGTVKAYSGPLRMNASCVKACKHGHGEMMARALSHQLAVLGNKPISARHIVWHAGLDLTPRILLAGKMNPRVVTMSIAGPSGTRVEREAIKKLTDAGILVLAAAGNQGLNTPEYPAAYDLPCLVAVSTESKGKKAEWDSGRHASAGHIYLPQVNGEQGTSFSTQRAAAYVFKYMETRPGVTCQEVERYLRFRFSPAQLTVK